MSETTLAVEIREKSGKGVARKLRAGGRIPAVLYGQGKDPVALALDPRKLESVLASAGHNALIDLEGASAVAGRTVLVKDLQREPVGGRYLHADLFEIRADEMITVSVPLHIVGTAVGVSMEGGLLDHALREVEVDCLPRAIPDSIDIDVSQLHLGESVHVSDLQVPDGVEIRTEGAVSIISIVAPSKAEEAAEPVEGAEAAEVAEGEAAEPAGAAAGGEDKPSEG